MKNGKYWAVPAAMMVKVGVAVSTAEFDALGNGIFSLATAYQADLHAGSCTKARPLATRG